ncbi:MAG TPA: hydantoinase B/oxoprolinase family protein [Casimicrobiaceae bacterium]
MNKPLTAATLARPIDPITLAVAHNNLMMVTSEMDLTQEKTSFSPIISEAMDRANGIYAPDTGELIVQGARGLPLFIGVMQATVRAVIERCGDLRPGDVVIINDPYLGGTHLMDVRLVAPFFHEGRIWAWLANSAHWADIGGSVAGGFSSDTTEVHQEGLRLPPIRICREGEIDRDLLALILANCRVPEERIGDLKAQLGAIRVGARRLAQLLDRYGAPTLEAVIVEVRQRSERAMRTHIEAIPDGRYSFEAPMDSDGISSEPLWVRLDLDVCGSDLHFDFSRSSPACRGPLNTPFATTVSAAMIGVRHVFPEVPMNAGCFAPLHIPPPVGTFLHAEYPRPVAGAAAECSQRVVETVLGALGKAVPERAYAGPFGTAGNISLGGYDPKHGRHYVMYYFSGGGYGGYWAGDGHTNACATIAFTQTQPFEILEAHYPVLFEHASIRNGSAGAGQYRGGFGISYRVSLRRGEASAAFMMDHGRFPPFALAGGRTGAMTEIEIRQSGAVKRPAHVSKGAGYELKPGDWIEVRTPGGGGWGDPRARDRACVARDVARGYLSAEQAAQDYDDSV